MTQKTKIYIITECPYVGVFRAIIELVAELSKMNFSIYFIFPSKTRDRYGENQQDHENSLSKYGIIVQLPLRRKYRYILSDTILLRKYLHNEGGNNIIISFTEYAGKISRILYKVNAIKTLYHAPQCIDVTRKDSKLEQFVEWIFERLLSQNVTAYLACGASETYLLNKKYNVPNDKIVLIPNFRSIKIKKKTKEKYLYVYVGRVVKEKGVYELLESFESLGLSNKLLIIGEGKELKRLKKKYLNTTFLGRLQPNEVLSCLSYSRFLVSNSIIEGLPYSLIEAMMIGVVPIVSNVEGHKDIIIDGYNGFLYNSQLDLTNLIFKMNLVDENYYSTISQNAVTSMNKLMGIAKQRIVSEFKKYESSKDK